MDRNSLQQNKNSSWSAPCQGFWGCPCHKKLDTMFLSTFSVLVKPGARSMIFWRHRWLSREEKVDWRGQDHRPHWLFRAGSFSWMSVFLELSYFKFQPLNCDSVRRISRQNWFSWLMVRAYFFFKCFLAVSSKIRIQSLYEKKFYGM